MLRYSPARQSRMTGGTQTQSTMNQAPRTLVVIAIGLCLTGTGLSQSAATGLLGRRHAGVDFTHVEFNGTRIDRARGSSLGVNVPFSEKFDLGMDYDHAHLRGRSYSASMKALGVSALLHEPTPYGEAYIEGALGYSWDRVTVAGVATREDGALWALRAGYEVPVASRTAVDASLGYSDAFSGRTTRNQRLEFRLQGSHAFTPRLTGVLSIAYQQIKREPDGMLYTGGVRWMF